MTRSARNLSDKLGFWQDEAGQPRRAYRARVSLTCAGCAARIAPGDVFARRTKGGQGSPEMQVVPYCSDCLPLRPIESRE